MAAVASTETVRIKINEVELDVPKGELIVESVKRLGLEIPIFCYHSRLKPVGMCRMCLVETGFTQPDGSVRMMPKPQAACTLPASDGMAIVTDSERVHRDRRGVLEFLLINHPLDCPICDRGGECPLQNNTLFYGPSTSRFTELKRHLPKAFPLSQYVTLDLERCIQCGRCVRFTEEISGDSELAFRFRGAKMTPSTFELANFQSKFSGNVIEICPVGALTNAKYRFRARPWDLETKPGICTVCSNGCSIWFDHRVGKMARINGRTNETVNEEWTCDRGKFGHDFYNGPDRLSQPMVRHGDRLEAGDWPEAYQQVLAAFAKGGAKVACLAGASLSNESLYSLQELFRNGFGSGNLDHRFERFLASPSGHSRATLGAIADLEAMRSILVFGTSLADEEPIIHLRVRKAWMNRAARVVVAHHAPTDADSFAEVVLRYREGTESAAALGILAAVAERGKVTLPAAAQKEMEGLTLAKLSEATGIAEADFRAAAEWAAGAAVVASRGLHDAEQGAVAETVLAHLAEATGGTFSVYARGANEQGAQELGFVPDRLPGGGSPATAGLNTHQILEAAAAGKLKALWLAECDPFQCHPDPTLVAKALEKVEFLVVQGFASGEAVHYASAVLPSTAPAEQDGTYTNCEGRVQRFAKVLPSLGSAKPAWQAATDLMLRIQPSTPPFSAREVMDRIGQADARFLAAGYDVLPEEGVRLG